MSEFEPIADKKVLIERADKLREMTQTAGWTEILLPELRRGIKEQKEILANSDFPSLLEVRLNQERIRWANELINNIEGPIREAQELQNEEIAKEHKDSPEA